MVQPVNLPILSETEGVIVPSDPFRSFELPKVMQRHIPSLDVEDRGSIDSAVIAGQHQGNSCFCCQLVEPVSVRIIVKEVFSRVDDDESSAGFLDGFTQ